MDCCAADGTLDTQQQTRMLPIQQFSVLQLRKHSHHFWHEMLTNGSMDMNDHYVLCGQDRHKTHGKEI